MLFPVRNRLHLSVLGFCCLVALNTPAPAQERRGPFTQSARSVRTRKIDQQHVKLELNFDWTQQVLKGRASHMLTLITPASSIELDAEDMVIDKVELVPDSLAGQPTKLPHTHQGNKLMIPLGREYPAGQKLKLAIDYTVTRPANGAHFVVPDGTEPGQSQMVWTQSEPEYARCWFPCLDAMNDRLTSEIVATVPTDYIVLSNGELLGKRRNDDQTATWHWSQTQNHSPYLMSVVAGDFEVLEQEWDGIPVLSYVPRGRLADAPRSFEKTPEMLRFFSEKIGFRYPWPKYAQICVDEYGWGGMEHTSATTLNLATLHDARAHHDVSSINLVAHELAHQWWGDLVTCKDWAELWLNESFATYFATLWTEHDEGADEAAWQRYREAESYFGEDARYRRSIVNYRYETPMNMFDSHSYPKGGRVLHMLRFELGEEMFWRAIQLYAEVNQFRIVETANLRIAIEDATGQGMNWFFDQWLYHGGHPEFTVDWTWDESSKDVKLTVRQTQKTDETTPLFRTSAEIEIALSNETLIKRVQLSKPEETFHFQTVERPSRVCFDPEDWILKKLNFPKSKEELIDQLTRDKHVICRLQALQGLQGLASQIEDPRVATLVRNTARTDSFWGVRQDAVKLVGKMSGDEARATLIKAAIEDPKSFVRREAIAALANFSHDESRLALRQIIDRDPSYYAVAEGLRCLVKIDRDNARDLLLAAIDQPSDNEVILHAACDGLAELHDGQAVKHLTELLEGKLTPERRVALLAGLAKLRPEDTATLKLLHEQLDSKRRNVRRAALDSITALGDASSLAALQARRASETSPRAVQALDEALEKLRRKQKSSEKILSEVESLRKRNDELEQRLKNLEAKERK